MSRHRNFSGRLPFQAESPTFVIIKSAELGVRTIRKSYQWHHPSFYLLAFPTPILNSIIARTFLPPRAEKFTGGPRGAPRAAVAMDLQNTQKNQVMASGGIPGDR